MGSILGLDLGKFKSVACSYDTNTNNPSFASLHTDPGEFRRFLLRQQPTLVVFETCTIAGWVADLCAELKLDYAVANPMNEAWAWRKVKRKTDRDDALKLARMAAQGELPTIPMPSPATREYRALVKYRDRLVTRRTAVQNHIRALCQCHGILLPGGHRAWTQEGRALIRSLAQPLDQCDGCEFWRGELFLEVELLEHLLKQLDSLEKALDARAAADPRVQLLRTIPGVGRCTAEVVVAHLDDASRFQNARQVSAYAGLVSRQFQSGETDRKGRITRRGPALLRKVLVEAAWLMQRYNPWAARLLKRVSRGQKVRRKQALVAVARKLLVRCWAILRSGKPWNEQLAGAS